MSEKIDVIVINEFKAQELMEHYQRPAPEGLEDAVPDTVFVDARKL